MLFQRVLQAAMIVAHSLLPQTSLAADSTGVAPPNLTWNKPNAATADTSAYATNAGVAAVAGSAGYSTSSGTASTANALCPSCTISGGQVSGTVASATNATDATYSDSSNYSTSSGTAGSAGYADTANYANSANYSNNSGYSYSSAAATGASCDTGGWGAMPNGTVITGGYFNCQSSYCICTSGNWATISLPVSSGGSGDSGGG